MKDFKPNKGWLIQCQGGPLGGNWIRAWNFYRGEETALDWEFKVGGHPDGRYVLKPLTLKNGVRKQAVHKGVKHDAFYYEWTDKNPNS